MLSRDQAEERAYAWLRLNESNEIEVSLHEFTLGWVAWVTAVVASSDPLERPDPVNGPRVVVDRETGTVVQWSRLPAEKIAEEYEALRASGERFPADIARVLNDSGWHPGRDVSAYVDAWLGQHTTELAELIPFPAARAVLDEFGGLRIPQFGRSGDKLDGHASYLHPMNLEPGGGLTTDEVDGLAEEFDEPVFPIGFNEDGPAELAIDAQGHVFFLHWADWYYLGTGFDTALINLVRGNQWPRAALRGWI